MKYSRAWRLSIAVLIALGVLTALVFDTPGANLAAFLLAACAVGAVSISLELSTERATAQALRPTLRRAARGGVIAVATLGYGTAVGLDVLLLILLVAATSPPVVAFLSPAEHPPVSIPRLPGRGRHAPEPIDLPDVTTELSELTAAELCLTWRRSFAHLDRCTGTRWASTIDLRRACLDELERRYPTQFASWLASGPRAAGDPSPFFTHTTT